MIRTFRHKGLTELWAKGRTSKVNQDLQKRCRDRLFALNAAESLNDLAVPGFDCHPLAGTNPQRYAIRVSGPWRMTFEFENGEALRVDLEQYH